MMNDCPLCVKTTTASTGVLHWITQPFLLKVCWSSSLQLWHLQASQTAERRRKESIYCIGPTRVTPHHLEEHAPSAPVSIHDTFIPQNLLSLSWLAAPFLPFCVGTKALLWGRLSLFSIWDNSRLLRRLQATPSERGRRRGRGRSRSKARNQGSVANLLWCTALQLWEWSQSPATIISLHTFKHRHTHTDTANAEVKIFITCMLSYNTTHYYSIHKRNCLGKKRFYTLKLLDVKGMSW